MTIVSGHQPAYLPWLGLLHKASLCDIFVYMDDVQFLDRDFNHRNRVITPDGRVLWLTIPIDRKNSSSLLLKDIRIKDEGNKKSWRYKHWQTLKTCYGKAPFFSDYSPFFEWVLCDNHWEFLADLNLVMLKQLFTWFKINAEIKIGSEQNFKGQKSDLVLEHCLFFKADTVVTGSQGKNYINLEDFSARGIKALFQKYVHPFYNQGSTAFVPSLSCVDLLFRYGPASPGIMRQDNISREML